MPHRTDDFSPKHGFDADKAVSGVVTLLVPTRAGKGLLPAGFPFAWAQFARRGPNLTIRAPGQPDAVVPGFFGDNGQTALMSADGTEVSRRLVTVMCGLSPRVRQALSDLGAEKREAH